MSKISHQFKCRIFAGKVISVDCPGFPSELFAAKIIDGRITLHNIARKQCRKNTSNINESNGSAHRVIAEQEVPLANSTPAKTCRLLKENKLPERRFSTPDIVRRVATQQRNTPISSPTAHQRLKFVALHRTPTANTPNKFAKIAPLTYTSSNTRRSGCVTQIQILRDLSNLSSFEIPSSPHTANNTITSGSPNQILISNFEISSSSLMANNTITSKSPNQTLITRLISSPTGVITKWRKCLTPQRTYIRRDVNRKTEYQLRKSTTETSQVCRPPKVVPNYFINQTKYPAGEGTVILQRRKLIFDKKLTISPKTFKKQLQYSKDLKCVDDHLPKTRKQFIYSHQLAFDLLTNSSHYPRSAKVLNSLFRRGCLNKKSETILKYQQLTKAIPGLEE